MWLMEHSIQKIEKLKTKFMKVGRHREMMANEHIAVGTNKNSIHEEVKYRLKSLML